MSTDLSQDIRDRTFAFACAVTRIVIDVRPAAGLWPVMNQRVRAATSVGANLEEAKAASSPREFVRYVEISLRSAREARDWLRICREVNIADAKVLDTLIGEADQLARIVMSSGVVSSRRTIPLSGSDSSAAVLAAFAFCILNFALHVS